MNSAPRPLGAELSGIRWEACDPAATAAELRDGAHPGALADAADAWRTLAAGLTSVGDHMTDVLDDVERSWTSSAASGVLRAMRGLRDRTSDLGAHVGDAAAAVGRQVEVADTARNAMPSAPEIDSVMAAERRSSRLGPAATASPITGGGARSAAAAHELRMRVTRTMQEYEAASAEVLAIGPRRSRVACASTLPEGVLALDVDPARGSEPRGSER